MTPEFPLTQDLIAADIRQDISDRPEENAGQGAFKLHPAWGKDGALIGAGG
ncbi:MAG: hypothetical protein NTV38_06710 [Chloroflexi bacterium]|nr:hypothetical protein [Chloroflexota bacterium]